MKRLFSTPLKIVGFITLSLAAFTLIIGGFFIFLGLYLLGISIIIYAVDFIIVRFVKNRNIFSILQLGLSISYVLFCFFYYMKSTEYNSIIFPDNYKGQAGIIFGIEGYPPLKATIFYKKKIEIPDNGILITSTQQEEIPSTIRYFFRNGTSGDYNKIFWEANFEYPCIVNNTVIKAWLFTFDDNPTLQVQKAIADLANEINNGQAKSKYTTENNGITEVDKEKYLSLQDRNLSFLPDAVGSMNVYEMILTGNNFTEIPKQVLAVTNLQDLLIGHNPITDLPPEIANLKRLKSLTVNATKIVNIKTDLSKLDSLEHFDFSHNETSHLPEQVKNIPNLTWLSLNNNKFQNLSFIDSRLNKIETLYLYTNEIKHLSPEIKLLPNLKELLIFDNQIDSIPDYISSLSKLEKLEIWNNPIKYISPEIKKLTKLKEMRIDDDYLSAQDKQNLKVWLPKCTINFQTRAEK